MAASSARGRAHVKRIVRAALDARGDQPYEQRMAMTRASILLVDGTCIFCNRIVAFILRHDREGLFHFAHLQSNFGRGALERHGRDPNAVDRIYLLVDAETANERLLVDGEAGRVIWPALFRVAVILRWVPLPILNVFYRVFARYRYRLFGKYDSCRVPSAEERGRFIADRRSLRLSHWGRS
jgi:predicted DCC family thiol-disulfide oxidoreductase YuxK